MRLFKTFDEALSWINGRLKFGVKPGLERMEWLLRKLGHPEKKLNAVHVAGTNGKGSTIAFLRSVLNEAGYTAGTFTSPYIITFNERISVDGAPISDEEWTALFNEVGPLVLELEKPNSEPPQNLKLLRHAHFYILLNTGGQILLFLKRA